MSNSNTNLQTQSSNALHNAIMEAGSKDRPPMLAPGNYVQWKSRIKRYIDTKPNRELIHYSLQNPPYIYQWAEKTVPVAEGSSETTTERYMENYKNVSQDIRDQMNAEAEAVQIILTGIDNDIYSTVDACPNACEMWKAIERLKQGESINVQDLETNLYWEFGKFTSRDGESLESYYSRFYKMMNELVRNQCNVTNHQVNVQFLLQLQPEWQRFVTLVKQSQELKTVSYHKLYDILKQHQNEVNEIRTERLARTANPLALVAQQQPVYHPPNHPTQNTQYSSTRSQQSTRNRGKAIVTSSAPTYDPEPATVTEDEVHSIQKSIRTDSTVQDDNSRSGNDTDADDADIRPIYDEEPMAEVQLTAGWQHGQILKQTSNKAKIEKEIDVLETMNIELEHSVATLHNIFALANNAELKAQIQEKVFAIAALKNDLRKLKGNSVDTKFDKTSVLGKPVLPSLRNQSVVRQPNAFKSERAQMSKQRFASQVDVNKNLSKPVTQHYLPKKTESAFAKPDHVIASSSSRNSSKNMPRFSSNDMVHNHYLDEARKKTQERDRNSKTSVMPSARFQSTADGSKPKPRSNNQTSRSLPVSKSTRVTITAVPKADHSKSSSSFSDSKQFVCSTCHKCVFNANHDACITKLLKEVNSRAKVPSNKTTIGNKPVEQIRITKKPERQIPTGHRFSIKKTSAVHEKTMTLRSCLRWKPTGKIFKTVGLRWVPTGKIFTPSTTKVDSEPPNGSNADITNQYESAQTLDVSAGTSNLSAAGFAIWSLFDEYFNGENQVVLKSSAVTTTDASNKRQQQPDSTSSTSTLATTVTANGNFNL
ncbi:hypothetical protein Tco_1170627 [Tanacetum coccineum]